MLNLCRFVFVVACFGPLAHASQVSYVPAQAVATRAADNFVATVTVTTLHTSTVLITTSSYAYAISTATILVTSTKTAYVSSTIPPPRRIRVRAMVLEAPAIPIANVRRATGATSTTTVEAGLTITSIVNIGAANFVQTVSSTTTTTLALAAPAYSHVYAARAGCQDTPTVDTLQLDPSITDRNDAVELCQDSCSQNGNCASLFVQLLFPSYGDTVPVYKCFMNGMTFDESSNLICELAKNVWGAADAYDAVGRGIQV